MRPDTGRARRALRRALPLVVLAAVCLLLAWPALFDLRRLFVGLALIALALAVVTAAFTYADKPVQPRLRD